MQHRLCRERNTSQAMFLQAAEQLITLLEQERDYTDAIMAAQQLLRQDPLHETTYRQLMRLYALRGDRAAALRVYHTCVTVLERELGTEPGEATREVYESLLQSNTSSEMLTGPRPPGSVQMPYSQAYQPSILFGLQRSHGLCQRCLSNDQNCLVPLP